MEDQADEPESPVEKIAEKIHGHDSSSSSSSSDSNSYVREVVAGLWVLSLIGKLFSVSNSVASVIYHSNLLSAFEAEINNTNDALVTLSVLELLYEVAPFAEKAVAVFKKHYAVFDAKVLSKIPRGPLKDKKKN